MERFMAALRNHGYEPRTAGAGHVCRCPGHDDHNPSLSINEGRDGRVLIHCHAGCTSAAVCNAVGLQESDLFEPDPSRRNGHAPRRSQSIPVAKSGSIQARDAGSDNAKTFQSASEAVAHLERSTGFGPSSRKHDYHDASGLHVGVVVRWDKTATRPKRIRPASRKPDGSGWVCCGIPTPRPPYHLPSLLAAPAGLPVFVTEGEKAAEAARGVGLLTTTSAHGSKSAAQTDWSALAGRDVVVLPDNDEPGEKYAADVTRLCMAAGAKSVRIVRLVELWAGMPGGGDMADLIEHGGGDADTIRSLVEALANKTAPEAVTPAAPLGLAFSPFPVDVLPEPLGAFVAEAARAIVCDASFVALPLLSGLASAIGNTYRIELKPGWSEPAIVWTAIVGESGTAKSPALELALRPIRKRQHEAMKRHAAELEKHRSALLVYERDVAHWKQSKPCAAPPDKPEAPTAERCWTDDATIESVAVLLHQNPRGLLMARDELAGWFNFDRYTQGKGAEAAKWLEMFGGRAMQVDRKGSGTLYIPHASVSIAGGIQPGTLRRALVEEHRDNGLAARLLFAMPPRKPKRWTEAHVNPAIQARVAAVFVWLFDLTPDSDDEGNERPRLVRLSDDGKRAWVAFYNEHAHEQVKLTGEESAAWSKLEGYAARLALLVHMIRRAAGDPTLADRELVDAASIAAGVVLARWFGNEARRVYAILGESEDGRLSRRLVEWIAGQGGGVTVRDVTHGVRAYRGDPDKAERALSDLVEAGVGCWVTDTHGPQGGRPTQRFRLVPSVTVTDSPTIPGEGVGSGDGDTGDTPTDGDKTWGEL